MQRRAPIALALSAALTALGLFAAPPLAAQDASTPPLAPPVATPIADPPSEPAGDGTGVRLRTELGDIVIGLFTESSPVAAENFQNLAAAGFYDGTVFHRIVPGFVIQGGDPTGSGTGDAGYSIVDEPVVGEYGRGIVAMARTQAPNSQGSQFFIVLDDDARMALDAARTYAIFGRVVEGMDVADAIAAGPSSGPPDDRALEPVAIVSTTIEQVVLPPEPSAPPPTIADALTDLLSLTVGGGELVPQSVDGAGLESQLGADHPLVVAVRGFAETAGRTMDDVALVVAGADLASGQPLDITGLRIVGSDAAGYALPFAQLITGDATLSATPGTPPATTGATTVLTLTGSVQDVPITAWVSGDTVLLIRTTDDAARDELLGQLP